MSEIGPFPYKHTPLSPDSSKREPYLSLDQNRFPPLTYSEYREIEPTLYFCTTEDRNANSSQWIIKKCSTAQWLTSMHLKSLLKDLIYLFIRSVWALRSPENLGTENEQVPSLDYTDSLPINSSAWTWMIPHILVAKIYILSTVKIAAIIYDKSVVWSLFDRFNFFFASKIS